MHLKKDSLNILIIILFVLFLTLPFANKAVHIDDTVFLYIANQVTKEPLKPYSFNLEWSTLTGLATHITDPPLISYYAALIMVLFGESKLVLHISYIIFPLLAGVSMYYISKKFTETPLFPTLFLITSATFVVMSHNFMLDIPFLALFLASLSFYIYGVDYENNYLIGLGAFFCSLALLTKYSGLVLLPILAVYSLFKNKPKSLIYLLIPLTTIVLWNLYTFKVYGLPHTLQIFYYMLNSQSSFALNSIIIRIITNFTYIGGASIFPLMLIYPFLLNKNNRVYYFIILTFALILSVILYFVSANFSYRYMIPQLMLFTFFLSTGMFFIFVIVKHYATPLKKLLKTIYSNGLNKLLYTIKIKYSNDFFLFSWLIIGFLFNSTIAGGAARYSTILIPPLMIMYFTVITHFSLLSAKKIYNFVVLTLILNLVLCIALSYADYQLAGTYRDFAEYVDKSKIVEDKGKVWFTGYLGFQYYMEAKGYTALGLNDNSPKKGDFIIKAKMPSPRAISPLLKERIVLTETKSYKSNFPLRIHNAKARAGFYTFGGGFLPYSFSNSNLEDFEIYKVIK